MNSSAKTNRKGKAKNKISDEIENKIQQILEKSSSGTTIYDRAVQKESDEECGNNNKNRFSNSSDEFIDTSEEMIDVVDCLGNCDLISERSQQGEEHFYHEQLRPGTSHERETGHENSYHDRKKQVEREARDRADHLIKEAEASKACILNITGKDFSKYNHYDMEYEYDNTNEQENFVQDRISRDGKDRHCPSVVDEDYFIIGNFVEEHIRQKIESRDYVDFARLFPRDRTIFEEENRMEIVNRNGKTYFIPANDLSDSSGITNFSRWEQAFRVYSNIYCKRFPDRSSELIQHNHVIHTAAFSYTWENIYFYDKDFRLHLSRYPHRSWAVILQQAWTMRLKDRNK